MRARLAVWAYRLVLLMQRLAVRLDPYYEPEPEICWPEQFGSFDYALTRRGNGHG